MATETLREEITTLQSYVDAIDRVISLARNEIRIFDYNLADGGFNSPQRQLALQSFLLSNRNHRLRIVVHNPDYVNRYCPRLLNLLRQFGHNMSINRTLPEAAQVYDPFIIADDSHYVHRFHYQNNRALLGINDNPEAQAMTMRFEEIWEASETAITASTLGL